MNAPRITTLTAPPVVGRWYLVPTVRYPWLYEGTWRDWPVFLPKHTDADRFAFKDAHYHVDPRFVTAALWARMKTAGKEPWADRAGSDGDAFSFVQRTPLARHSREPGGPAVLLPHPPMQWRRMRCARAEVPYVFGHREEIQRLRSDYAGRECKAARGGWVCPHQGFPMGSLAPDDQGFITCPLHGLKVRAADGVVLDG